MSSVTTVINSVKCPSRFIKLSNFEKINMNDGIVLNEKENINPSIIGLVVDYLTRFNMEKDKIQAFKISMKGALYAEENFGLENSKFIAKRLFDEIEGIDEKSIINACKLVNYDVWFRNPLGAIQSYFNNFTIDDINPDKATIENIQILLQRSIKFFEKYGNPTKYGFTFGPEKENKIAYENMIETGKGTYGGYTPTVSSGDGDFLTKDTLWEFKVLKSNPTTKHMLQTLIYYIMGKHSGKEIYKDIKNIGIFNPRLNMVYLCDMKNISEEIIKSVQDEIICY